MKVEDAVRKADDTLYEILREFRFFRYIHPQNYREEKEKFFENYQRRRVYQPFFEYEALPTQLPAYVRQIQNLTLPSSPLGTLYEQIRTEILKVIAMIEARGNANITEKSIDLYGKPDAVLQSFAMDILKRNRRVRNDPPVIGVKALVENLRDKIREERIEGWDVTEDAQITSLAQVDWARKKVRLQCGLLIDTKMKKRLFHHQIEVHVFRAANGERQPLKAFAFGMDQYLETEEGLALTLEEALGLMEGAVAKRYAGRVIAAHRAMGQSFYDLFSFLFDFFDPDEAFSLTMRSKRGIQNTADPGGLIYDHVFLRGYQTVRALSKKDRETLFVGKVAVHHLPLLRELLKTKQIFHPVFLPRSFQA